MPTGRWFVDVKFIVDGAVVGSDPRRSGRFGVFVNREFAEQALVALAARPDVQSASLGDETELV